MLLAFNQIVDISMAEIDALVQPDRITDDIGERLAEIYGVYKCSCPDDNTVGTLT